MRRRNFLRLAGGAVLGTVSGLPNLSTRRPTLTLVLRGGRWFAAGRWQTGDIGIDDAGRIRLGAGLEATAVRDVGGLVVSPGFIDVLADHGGDPASTFPVFERFKISDGVTTALQMHGGTTASAAYYRLLGSRPRAINYGASTFVMGIRGQAATIAERLALVERNLDEGALGVSHSLESQPTPYDELLQYARLARKYQRPVFLHLRYSSAARELEGVDEAIRLARESGARVHIGHLHSTGGTFHMEEALELIRRGIASGLPLTTCVYPYSYWATYLSSRRFDPGWRERYRLDYADLRLVGTGERLTAASFAAYRRLGKLVAVPEGTMPLERTVEPALKADFCMIGSDGGIQREPRANSHPRGAGCFATALRYGLDRGVPLERMIEKMTSLPASVVQAPLRERGSIAEGAWADLTVFDPDRVRGAATVENPNQTSIGISLVLVGGRPACEAGRIAARSGVPIRA